MEIFTMKKMMEHTQKNALIIEDDNYKIALFTELLADYADSITIVRTGSQALRIVEKQTFSHILVDDHLPDCKGSDILDLLKIYNQNASYISISYDDTVLNKFGSLGYNDVLMHPFDFYLNRVFGQPQSKVAVCKVDY